MKKYRIGFIVLLSFCIYPFMGSMAQNGIASSDVGMRFWRQGQYEKAAKVFQKRSKFSLRDAFLLKDCYTDWVLNSVNMNSEAEKYMSDAEFNISMLTDGKEKSAEDIISLIDFGNSLAASKDADDRAAAYTYFREAAHYDNTGVAQYFLGCLYYNGSAPVSSEALAYFWFTESSKMGFPNGTHMLGVCWRDGVYVSENKKKAFELFLQAAKAGVAAAQYDTGLCYANGSGVNKNSLSAQYWFKMAADQDFEPAKKVYNGVLD